MALSFSVSFATWLVIIQIIATQPAPTLPTIEPTPKPTASPSTSPNSKFPTTEPTPKPSPSPAISNAPTSLDCAYVVNPAFTIQNRTILQEAAIPLNVCVFNFIRTQYFAWEYSCDTNGQVIASIWQSTTMCHPITYDVTMMKRNVTSTEFNCNSYEQCDYLLLSLHNSTDCAASTSLLDVIPLIVDICFDNVAVTISSCDSDGISTLAYWESMCSYDNVTHSINITADGVCIHDDKYVSVNCPIATSIPTIEPTEFPTEVPTNFPTELPTELPTSEPTEHECFIGSKCTKTKECCTADDPRDIGIICAHKEEKKNKKVCCVKNGKYGCVRNDDCCGDTSICFDGICLNPRKGWSKRKYE